MRKKGVASIVIKVLLGLLAVVLVYAAIFGISVMDVKNETDVALQTYERLEASIHDGKFEEALECVHELANSADKIEQKTGEWQWQVASVIPYVSEDIRCVRGVATICDLLANDALMPALTRAETIVEDVSSFSGDDGVDFDKVSSIIDEVTSFPDDLKSAREVVNRCQKEAEELPESHFEELNTFVDKLCEVTDQVESIYQIIDSAISGLKSLAGRLLIGQ